MQISSEILTSIALLVSILIGVGTIIRLIQNNKNKIAFIVFLLTGALIVLYFRGKRVNISIEEDKKGIPQSFEKYKFEGSGGNASFYLPVSWTLDDDYSPNGECERFFNNLNDDIYLIVCFSHYAEYGDCYERFRYSSTGRSSHFWCEEKVDELLKPKNPYERTKLKAPWESKVEIITVGRNGEKFLKYLDEPKFIEIDSEFEIEKGNTCAVTSKWLFENKNGLKYVHRDISSRVDCRYVYLKGEYPTLLKGEYDETFNEIFESFKIEK